MKCLTIYILFCSLYIKQIQNAPSSNRAMHFEIDEFINQLMTSEKFNELADVIAERAARKIQTVEKSNKTALRNSDHSDKTENKKHNEDKENYARISKHEQKKIKDNSGKFGKINTKAFLKHDDSSQELYLNYKHMTEELQRTQYLDKKSPKKVEDDKSPERDIKRFSDNSREQSYSKHKNKEKNVYESNERKNIKMKTRIDKNINKGHFTSSNGEHSDKDLDSISNKTSLNPKRIHKSSHDYSGEDKTLEISNEDNNISVEKQKNNLAPQTTQSNIDIDYVMYSSHVEREKNTRDHTQVTKETKENTSLNYSSREVVEVGINRAHSDKEELSGHHSAEKLDFLDESNEKQGVIKPKKNKPIIRLENGKLYTFVSSPDYDEYHENLAQLKISKRNFINTKK